MMTSDTNDRSEGDLPRSIGPPARRTLAAAGYTELLRLHGVGPKATRLLREALAAQSVAFAERDR